MSVYCFMKSSCFAVMGRSGEVSFFAKWLFQIEKLAMLSSKEARELCYQLLEKEFVLMKVVTSK